MDKENTRHYTSRRCSRAAGGVCTGSGGQASSCSQVWYPCRAGAGGDAGVLMEVLGTVLQQHLCRQAHAQSRSCITVYGWWVWLHRVCGHWGVWSPGCAATGVCRETTSPLQEPAPPMHTASQPVLSGPCTGAGGRSGR